MQIVIDIPDNVFKRLVAGEVKYGGITAKNIFNLVKKGTPLPKGHGRIIDESKITKCEQVGLIIKHDNITRCLMTDAPTIIKADKEE